MKTLAQTLIWMMLLSAPLWARIYLDAHHGNFRGWYDEDKEQIIYIDTLTHKRVLTHPLEAGLFETYNRDERVVKFKHIDFDGHKDIVIVPSGSIYLYRNGRFVYYKELSKILNDYYGTCNRNKTTKEIIITHQPSNAAPWDSYTFYERLFFRFERGKAVLFKSVVTDYDICTLMRHTTTHYRRGKERVSVHYTLGDDKNSEVFFEAPLDSNRHIRICRGLDVHRPYAFVLYDDNRTLLSSHDTITRAVAYRENNQTVMQFYDRFSLTMDHNGTVYFDDWHDANASKHIQHLRLDRSEINGTLANVFAPHPFRTNIFTDHQERSMYTSTNTQRAQHAFVRDDNGLVVIDNLADGTFKTVRINIPCGGQVMLDLYWGNDPNIVYFDGGEELEAVNLKTARHYRILNYDMIGPNTRMVFARKHYFALFWIDDFDGHGTIHLINLKSHQNKKVTTFDSNRYKNFAFNRRETHLILTAKNGKKKRIRLPKL
jgi:hemin uptake protein HemP